MDDRRSLGGGRPADRTAAAVSLPREPFSWEGENDLPVPLDGSTPNEAEVVSPDTLSAAETVVRVAQQAIAREDTDPTTVMPVLHKGVAPRGVSQLMVRVRVARRPSPRSLGLLTALGCALAFAHGWSVGARAAETALPSILCCAPLSGRPEQYGMKGEEFR